MIVVDSSVWIDHFNDRRDEPAVRTFRAIPDPTEVLVGDVILLELLRGARGNRHAARLAAVLEAFETRSMLDARGAVLAARNDRLLREKGVTLRKLPNLVIASFCMDGGHDLLTKDREFLPFAEHLGLRLR